jgi:hypothetical protein
MGYKILNVNLAGQKVAISDEIVEFDKDGIAELGSEESFKGVINLPNFVSAQPIGPKEDGEVTDYEEIDEPEDVDSLPQLVSDNMNHKELDAKAEELGIEVKGEKKDKIATINAFIVDNF